MREKGRVRVREGKLGVGKKDVKVQEEDKGRGMSGELRGVSRSKGGIKREEKRQQKNVKGIGRGEMKSQKCDIVSEK